MAEFTVDVEGLAALGTNLDRGRELMGSTLAAMREVGATALGTDELDRACAEFQQSWDHGLGKVTECIDAVRGGITQTRAAYAELERALTEGFIGMRDRLGQE